MRNMIEGIIIKLLYNHLFYLHLFFYSFTFIYSEFIFYILVREFNHFFKSRSSDIFLLKLILYYFHLFQLFSFTYQFVRHGSWP